MSGMFQRATQSGLIPLRKLSKLPNHWDLCCGRVVHRPDLAPKALQKFACHVCSLSIFTRLVKMHLLGALLFVIIVASQATECHAAALQLTLLSKSSPRPAGDGGQLSVRFAAG